MSLPIIAVNQMAATGHIVTFNETANAMASAAIYAFKASHGLNLTLHGGVYRTPAGVVIVVPDQSVKLTASATNYLYADGAGLLQKATSPPSGWPGPMAAGTALYTLIVGTNAITSGTSICVGRQGPGPQGAPGAQGEVGSPLWLERRRDICLIGDTQFYSTFNPGFGTSSAPVSVVSFGSNGNIAFAGTAFYESILKQRYMAHSAVNYFNATRGFQLGVRFGVDIGVSFTPADFRCFCGLYDITAGTPSILTIASGGIESSAMLNIIGIGCDSADANASIIHNDGSGTGTKVALGSSFPMKTAGMGGIGHIYDATFTCAAGASEVTYTAIEAKTGTTATGTLSTNLPAATQNLGWIFFAGGNNALVTVMFCQVAGLSRF